MSKYLKFLILTLLILMLAFFISCTNVESVETEIEQQTSVTSVDSVEETEITEETEVEISVVETTEEELKKEFSPTITGNISIFGFPYNVHVAEDYAYIAGMGLNIIDITDKENPKMVGMLQSNAWWRVGFYIEEDFAYFPYEIQDKGNFSEGGLQIIDVSDKNGPAVVGTVKSEGRIKDVWVIEDYAYATYEIYNEKSGVQIINVSDKKNPITVGVYEIGNFSISSIRIESNYLYILVGDILKIMDISDKESLVGMSSYPISGTMDFYIEGNYLYLPSDNSLQIIDVSDKENPIIAVDILASGEVTDVFINNNNAFITYVIRDSEDQVEKSGVQIIDVEDKNNPALIAELEIPGQAMGIFIKGDYAYVGAGPQAGLQIIKLFNE